MSKVAISGNASGTGTFTIQAPNSNTDRVLALPDEAGTVLTSASSVTNIGGPAFFAHSTGSNVALTNATYTKVILDVEQFDTDSCFDSTTNYRFTPNVAGYYWFHGTVYSNWTGTNYTSWYTLIYKNGTAILRTVDQVSGTQYGNVDVSGLSYMNGSTDYVELYVRADGGTSPVYSRNGSLETNFQGYFVRGA